MKLWIIHKEGIGFSKIIAEMLQDLLEEYMDIDVGSAIRIEPDYLVEEKLDYLIIGDTISDIIPNLEIQNWLLKYGEISKKNSFVVKAISGFYIAPFDIKNEPLWMKSLHENINAEMIYPPILCLRLSNAELALENKAFERVKAYSNDFIEFFIEKKLNEKSISKKGDKKLQNQKSRIEK